MLPPAETVPAWALGGQPLPCRHTNWTNLRHLLEHAKRKGFKVGAVDISGEANAIPARSAIPHLAEQWPAVRDAPHVGGGAGRAGRACFSLPRNGAGVLPPGTNPDVEQPP